VRISELSRRSGVPVPTVKYYLREGLLKPGRLTAATQAQYDEHHVQRLRLIRALTEVGGLALATIRRILDAIDDERLSLHQLLGQAHYALSPNVGSAAAEPGWTNARTQVDKLLDELGWEITEHAPARDELTRAVLALHHLGAPTAIEDLRPYAKAAHSIAAHEFARLAQARDAGDHTGKLVHQSVIGTVLYEPVLLALRRLAHEHESAQHFSKDEDDTRPNSS
jgi:DNA-binding transcriptional MerR regulator